MKIELRKALSGNEWQELKYWQSVSYKLSLFEPNAATMNFISRQDLDDLTLATLRFTNNDKSSYWQPLSKTTRKVKDNNNDVVYEHTLVSRPLLDDESVIEWLRASMPYQVKNIIPVESTVGIPTLSSNANVVEKVAQWYAYAARRNIGDNDVNLNSMFRDLMTRRLITLLNESTSLASYQFELNDLGIGLNYQLLSAQELQGDYGIKPTDQKQVWAELPVPILSVPTTSVTEATISDIVTTTKSIVNNNLTFGHTQQYIGESGWLDDNNNYIDADFDNIFNNDAWSHTPPFTLNKSIVGVSPTPGVQKRYNNPFAREIDIVKGLDKSRHNVTLNATALPNENLDLMEVIEIDDNLYRIISLIKQFDNNDGEDLGHQFTAIKV